ncbi:MAG: hypothetical protein K2N85_13045 [Lachnospiraceae bacterium]|nr:hypothetical protein [Lachnospiraceae bacterium]
MNSVGFSGKLKKKYNAIDVQNAICTYVKEHGITVQCPDETKTFVDFGIDSEGFCFAVENGKLTEQYVKHEVDNAGKSWYIYELLYQLRSLFTAYEVFDDFGMWAEFCYQKEPVLIKLRELTEEEAKITEHLNLFRCTDSCQMLLGIIELFIWDKGPFIDKVLGDWSIMIQKIRNEVRRVAPLWLEGIIDAWIYYCMDFCGKPVSEYPENHKKLNAALDAACFGFQANIIHVWCGCTGKLEKDITVFFEYENQKYKRQTGFGLDESFVGVYRYVLSSLEYLGFRIRQQPNYPSEKLDVACFDYYSLI